MQPGEPEAPKRHRLLLAVAITLPLLVLAVVFVASLPKPAVGPATNLDVASPSIEKRKGVALVPRTKDTPKFGELLNVAPELGGVVTWTGDWAELSQPTSGAQVLMSAAKQYDFTPVVMVTLHNNSAPSKLLRPLNPDLIDQYAQDAADFIRQNPLGYFGMGVEVNNLKKDDPAGYQNFVDLFNKATDAIKQVSPDTKVFTVFQLERTKGLNGGLFGGTNDPGANTWALVGDFAKADAIGFTTYPYLIHKNPGDIPADYYSEIASRVNKPILFTEVGWPSRAEAAGWDSTEAVQAQFVNRFFELTKPLDPKLVIWPFAYDPPADHPFASVGLANVTGEHKPAWDTWVSN